MAPSPILPYHVQLILHYIAPPSELDSPVPPHLLSRALCQRHSLLDLHPSDPPSYLSWQASAHHTVAGLLESLANSSPCPSPPFSAVYSADEQNTFAHVHISATGPNGLRLVFDWDERDRSWKYHDAALMPFPPNTFTSLDHALSPHHTLDTESTDVHTKPPRSPKTENTEDVDDDDDDDDDYWNMYARSGTENGIPAQLQSIASTDPDAEDGEDAYWAQYGSIHGTADSTIPTPSPRNRSHKMVLAPDDPLPIPPAMMTRPRTGPRDPPSPSTLALRLNEIPPWTTRSPSALHSPVEFAFDDVASYGETEPFTNGHTIFPGLNDIAAKPVPDSFAESLSIDGSSSAGSSDLLSLSTENGVTKNGTLFIANGSAEDDGIREVIRGAYRLWKAVHTNAGTREGFIHLVNKTIEGL